MIFTGISGIAPRSVLSTLKSPRCPTDANIGPALNVNSARAVERTTINGKKASAVSVVLVATAFPIPEHRAEVIAACEAAITRVHDEPGVELYALHEGPDRLVMIEKYESEQALSDHLSGAALADLMSALEGKLTRDLDVQVLAPHPTGNAQMGAV